MHCYGNCVVHVYNCIVLFCYYGNSVLHVHVCDIILRYYGYSVLHCTCSHVHVRDMIFCYYGYSVLFLHTGLYLSRCSWQTVSQVSLWQCQTS